MAELEKDLSIYESFVSSGNETLDIVLTDKFLSCRASGVNLSYMADATALQHMEKSDVYALFCNMLDNAIEYVKNLTASEKRFIRLSVKPINNMLMIHQENYFEGDLRFSGGLPETTKNDKAIHGYGVKSMQFIAEKYGGKVNFKAEDGLFTTDILLPKI